MTCYPKNVQFTNLKINSEQDLFAIDPTIPTNNDLFEDAECNNECIPLLDLIPPCNNILAAFKVKGSAVICKGVNIGNTEAEISGTIRFNGTNFEGYNGVEWVPLDCCSEIERKCKIYTYDDRGGINVKVGDLVTIGGSKDIEDSVHKLLCDKWDWSARISDLGNERRPKTIADKCGKAFVVGYSSSASFPNFYNSDETLGPDTFSSQVFSNNFIFMGKINSIGCWEYLNAIGGNTDIINPEVTIDCFGSLYLSAQTSGGAAPIYYNYDSTVGLTGLNSPSASSIIAKLSGSGIWEWDATIQYSPTTTNPNPILSSDVLGNLYVVTYIDASSVATVYDSGNNTLVVPTSANNQILITLFESDGSSKWVASVNGLSNQDDGNVMVDGVGNAYVSGIGSPNNPPIFYDKDRNTDITGMTETNTQLWVGKLCYDGNWEWTNRVTNVVADQAIMSNDIDCNLYVGLLTDNVGNTKFHNADNSITISANNNSLYVAKLSNNGFWYWGARISTTPELEDKSITSIDVDGNGYIYVSGDASSDMTFYNIDDTVGKTLNSLGGGKYVWLGRLNPYGCWDWVVQVDSSGDDVKSSISADENGNVFLSGQGGFGSEVEFRNPPDNTDGITGVGNLLGEIFIGKIVNEAQSAKLIGVVTEVINPDWEVCVQFEGNITFEDETFMPGAAYYYDCDNQKLTSYCFKNSKLFRNIGVACDTNGILWNPHGKFCIQKEKSLDKVVTCNNNISGTFIFTTNPGYSTNPSATYKANKVDNTVTLTINNFTGTPDVGSADIFETDTNVLDPIFRPSHEVTAIIKIIDAGTENFGTLTVSTDGKISFTNNFSNFSNQIASDNMIGNCSINYVV